jgi:hypothetical protein
MGVIGHRPRQLLKGDQHHAANVYKQGLRLAQHLDDRRTAATYMEALAWIASEDGKPARAVALMGAAQTVGRTVGNYVFLFPNCLSFTMNATAAPVMRLIRKHTQPPERRAAH